MYCVTESLATDHKWLWVLNDFITECGVLISCTFFLWSLMAILEETKSRRQCIKWFGVCLLVGSLLKSITSMATKNFCTSRFWILMRMLLNSAIIVFIGIGQWLSNYILAKIKGYVDKDQQSDYLATGESDSIESSTTKMQSLNVKFMISQIF